MHALVTGAGGFLGQYLVEQLLVSGAQVRGFGRRSYPQLEELGVEMFRGDIRDAAAVAEACAGIDVVFHAAAIAGIWGPWSEFHGINTIGTQNVIAACHTQGVGKLIYTSSPSVTFDGDAQCDVDESAPYPDRWLCHYPHTKALAEQSVLSANGHRGLLTCALRPHLIWGPRDQHLIPRLLDRARRGKLMRVGDGTNLVDMIYVENAAAAHLQAASALADDSPVAGQVYFISQGEPVNCWDWINEILSLANLPPVSRSISFRAAWRVGRAMEMAYHLLRKKSEPRMTRFLAAQLAKSHYFCLDRARLDFGFTPIVSTEEAMCRLAADLDSTGQSSA